MFCPVCKAEYRQGIARCADCDADLVAALPQKADSTNETGDPLVEAAILLCRESDPATLTAILIALDNAQIPYHEFAEHDPRAWLYGPFPSSPHWSIGMGHEIRVRASDLEPAREIVEKILEKEQEPTPPASSSDSDDSGLEGATPQLPKDWDPAAATLEVWSGDEGQIHEFVSAALRENGIPVRELSERHGRRVVLVRPEDRDRAREIVREMTDGTPPK